MCRLLKQLPCILPERTPPVVLLTVVDVHLQLETAAVLEAEEDACLSTLDVCRRNDPLLEIAMELEHIATHDEYFIKRGLYPNVDFFSGIVLRAMGIPVSM